ncbi:MAG: phosphatidylserine decarboxylase [Desulfobacterales bacterium]
MAIVQLPPHQFIERDSGRVVTETLFSDQLICRLYSTARERIPSLFSALVSPRVTSLLGFINYDMPFGTRMTGADRLIETLGIDLSECLAPAHRLATPRRLFERQIRYWDCRPMPEAPGAVVSPADSRILVGSLSDASLVFLKEKFFDLEELVGADESSWQTVFRGGDFAVCRLTPEKYHYNHTPVAGRVVDIYGVDGACHSCNPAAVVAMATPYSKNRRVVTVIDTDVEGGTGVGKVAMIEVVALMIGGIRQCYSDVAYDDPRDILPGMFLDKGRPKSVFLPGSSVDVLLFEKGRVRFDPDIIANQHHAGASSRFSKGFGRPLVETDLRVRTRIGSATGDDHGNE